MRDKSGGLEPWNDSPPPSLRKSLVLELLLSGEDIAVALIVDHTDATPDGRARALLDPQVIAAAKAGEVVLFGRVSGTIAVRGLS